MEQTQSIVENQQQLKSIKSAKVNLDQKYFQHIFDDLQTIEEQQSQNADNNELQILHSSKLKTQEINEIEFQQNKYPIGQLNRNYEYNDSKANRYQSLYENDYDQVKIGRDSIDTIDIFAKKQQINLNHLMQNRDIRNNILSSPKLINDKNFQKKLKQETECQKLNDDTLQSIILSQSDSNFEQEFKQFLAQQQQNQTYSINQKDEGQFHNCQQTQQVQDPIQANYIKNLTPITEIKSAFEQSPSVNDILKLKSAMSLNSKSINQKAKNQENQSKNQNEIQQSALNIFITSAITFASKIGILIIIVLLIFELSNILQLNLTGVINPLRNKLHHSDDHQQFHYQQLQNLTELLHTKDLHIQNLTHELNKKEFQFETHLNLSQNQYSQCMSEKQAIQIQYEELKQFVESLGEYLTNDLLSKSLSSQFQKFI